MKDLTKYFIDLQKCSEEERKQIAKLILIESGLSMSDYLDLLHGKIDEPNGYYLLEYAREQWHLSYDVLKHKTELAYPEFIKLFKSAEEENNGWIKIESEADLPKEIISCWFKRNNSEEIDAGLFIPRDMGDNSVVDNVLENCTHYQPIIKPEPPKF